MGSLDFTVVLAAWPKLLAGLGYDLLFAISGFVCGCVLGFVCYLASQSRFQPIQWISYTYIQVVRGMPMYLLLLWLYFGLASQFGLALSGPQAIILAIAIMSSAFCAEVFRSGYGALDTGQVEAGRALGMTAFSINRYILLPQVVRTTIPPLLNILVICFKASTYAAVVAVPELVFQAQDISLNHYRPFEAYITVGAMLIATVLLLSLLSAAVERRLAIP
jgi:His/Glu/Gln/Arg/opine family amino acid ABC transporter permease subunit